MESCVMKDLENEKPQQPKPKLIVGVGLCLLRFKDEVPVSYKKWIELIRDPKERNKKYQNYIKLLNLKSGN